MSGIHTKYTFSIQLKKKRKTFCYQCRTKFTEIELCLPVHQPILTLSGLYVPLGRNVHLLCLSPHLSFDDINVNGETYTMFRLLWYNPERKRGGAFRNADTGGA